MFFYNTAALFNRELLSIPKGQAALHY